MEHKPSAPPADGFFGRWSRRKDAVRQGDPVADPQPTSSPVRPDVPQPSIADRAVPAAQRYPTDAEVKREPAKPLSLANVQSLAADSDFVPFMARGVTSEVRNAAMKKLFADPHYNVMDGLDIYIDDYSKSVPLPLEVIKRLASAKFLGLFEEEPQADATGLSEDDDKTLLTLPGDDAEVVANAQTLEEPSEGLQQQKEPPPFDRADT